MAQTRGPVVTKPLSAKGRGCNPADARLGSAILRREVTEDDVRLADHRAEVSGSECRRTEVGDSYLSGSPLAGRLYKMPGHISKVMLSAGSETGMAVRRGGAEIAGALGFPGSRA